MVLVEEAEKIILSRCTDFGTETVPLEQSLGRVLAAAIKADRAMPPFNRSTMDGITFSSAAYGSGLRQFRVIGTQAAGDAPIPLNRPDDCVEIMTGAAVPDTADLVVPYEQISIQDGLATVNNEVVPGQNIHHKGQDRRAGDILVKSGHTMDPFSMAVAASVGKTLPEVKKLPRILIVSTGNELVSADDTPGPFQIRRSNNQLIRAVLLPYGVQADMLHLPDDLRQVQQQLADCLPAYDAILLSGGVSMGKFDYLPRAFEALGIRELFYKVQQRPGKPLWFGEKPGGPLIFAFPGNPVASFLCLLRYFVPWLTGSMGIAPASSMTAVLSEDFTFTPKLQYFLQVRLAISSESPLTATPLAGNGSGDFSNLLDTQAFMELPAGQSRFGAGERFRVWPYRPSFLSSI